VVSICTALRCLFASAR